MCNPALLVVGLSVASAGLQVAQQQQQVKTANRVGKANNKAAERAFSIESAAQGAAAQETAAKVSAERSQNALTTARAQGGAIAAAGSSGVGGGALDAVLNDFARQQGQANASLGQTLRFSGQNRAIQQRASFERTVSNARISNPRQTVGALDYGGAILGGVNTGLSLYSGFSSARTPKSTRPAPRRS